MAQGAYIAFLDSDDISLPHRLSSQIAVLEGEPDVEVLFGGYDWIDESGAIIPWQHSWEVFPELNRIETWLFDCPVVPSATMVRAGTFRSVGGFAADLHGGEDWNLWMRMQLAGYRMLWQHDIVCLYRHHAASLSNDALSMARDCPQALQRILEHPAFPSDLLAEGARALALRYVDSMKRLYAQRLWEDGSDALVHALALDPVLLDGSPCRIEYELVGLSLDPLIGDGESFLLDAVKHLPTEAERLVDRTELMLGYRRSGFPAPPPPDEAPPAVGEPAASVVDQPLPKTRGAAVVQLAYRAISSRLRWLRHPKEERLS
jgi:hypothetical protein